MTDIAELVRTQVDLSGLMRVLAKNLYSTPEVAVRELVQNAHDSCVRRQLEDKASFEPRIVVIPDPAAGTLTIEDTGAGLTREEIDRYLATVGAGYTGKLREKGLGDGLIGQFGIGFLSAYVVSERVELSTTSYQTPDTGWLFSSSGGERYSVRSHPPAAVGTRVLLRLNERFRLLSDPEAVLALLRRYCCLLPIPIHLGSASRPAVNRPPPPWHPSPGEAPSPLRRRKLALEFAQRFERQFEPLCTFDVAPAHGGEARGLLWVQDGGTYGTSDNRNVCVFVRGMMVSRDARDLLPEWAGFCGGVIEANGLNPTASREDIQKDAAFEATAAQLREVLIAGLAQLAKDDAAAWRRVLGRHNEALLGAALCDERLFALCADVLKVPTSEGDLTLPAIRRRGGAKVHVSTGEAGGSEEVLFRALGVPVVEGVRYGALPFTRRYVEREGGQAVMLGTREGNAQLFKPAQVEPQLAERLKALFAEDGVEVVPCRFSPPALPLVLVPDRDVALKERLAREEADKRIGAAVLGLARAFTANISSQVRARLYANLEAPALQAVLEAPPERAREGARMLRALCTLMAHRDGENGGQSVSGALEQLSGALVGLLAGER
ncbi:MAG TPA: ATP-binding protein [Longimicrobium sp.]|nr:ATP-binding protein [Longimicrobium sp.]